MLIDCGFVKKEGKGGGWRGEHEIKYLPVL